MLRGMVRPWLLSVLGLLNRKGMERLLGLKTVGGIESFSSWFMLLEARGRQ